MCQDESYIGLYPYFVSEQLSLVTSGGFALQAVQYDCACCECCVVGLYRQARGEPRAMYTGKRLPHPRMIPPSISLAR